MYEAATDQNLMARIDSIFERYDREQSGCLPLQRLSEYCNEVFLMAGDSTVVGQQQAVEAMRNLYPRAEVINKQMMLAVVK